jgi:hypothetical protein
MKSGQEAPTAGQARIGRSHASIVPMTFSPDRYVAALEFAAARHRTTLEQS